MSVFPGPLIRHNLGHFIPPAFLQIGTKQGGTEARYGTVPGSFIALGTRRSDSWGASRNRTRRRGSGFISRVLKGGAMAFGARTGVFALIRSLACLVVLIGLVVLGNCPVLAQ